LEIKRIERFRLLFPLRGSGGKKEVKNMMLYCVKPELVSKKDKQSMIEYWASSIGEETIS